MNVRKWIVAVFVLGMCVTFSQTLLAQEMKFELNKGYGIKDILGLFYWFTGRTLIS